MEWARGFLEKKVYLVLAALLLYCTSTVWAAPATLAVNVNQSLSVAAYQVTKASIANPEIADIVVISNQELVLIGKKPGNTTLRIWTANGSRYTYEVSVGNLNNAGATEIEGLLGYPGIRVSIVGSTVMLEGSVRDQNEKMRAEKVAIAYAEKVVNLLEITNPKQVRLEVRVLEISSTKAKQMGIQFGNTITGTDGSVSVGSPGIFLMGQGMSNSAGNTWGGLGAYADIGATVSALTQNGDAELLSSPSIVTMSGEKANILIGGELPIPVAYENGKFSVEWKEYGIKLNIEPIVDSKDRIHSNVKAEVSNIDSTSSYAISIPNTGYHIPALRTRRAESVVEMSSGATMAIGGLISSEEGRQITKIPLLGDLPVLGQFFRHTQNSKERREIIILVTPYLTSDKETPKVSKPMKELLESEDTKLGNDSAKAASTEPANSFKARVQSLMQEKKDNEAQLAAKAVAAEEAIAAKKAAAATKATAKAAQDVKKPAAAANMAAKAPEEVKKSAAKVAAEEPAVKKIVTADKAAMKAPEEMKKPAVKESVKEPATVQQEKEPAVKAKSEIASDQAVSSEPANGFKTRFQSLMQEKKDIEAKQAAEAAAAEEAIAAKKAAAEAKAADKAAKEAKKPAAKEVVKEPAAKKAVIAEKAAVKAPEEMKKPVIKESVKAPAAAQEKEPAAKKTVIAEKAAVKAPEEMKKPAMKESVIEPAAVQEKEAAVKAKQELTTDKVVSNESESGFKTRVQSLMKEKSDLEAQQAAAEEAIAAKKAAAAAKAAAKAAEEAKKPAAAAKATPKASGEVKKPAAVAKAAPKASEEAKKPAAAVKAPTKASEEAKNPVAKDALKEALKEVVREALKEAVDEAVDEAVKEAASGGAK